MTLAASRRISAPAGRCWRLLARTAHWPEWGPSIRRVEPEDAEVAVGLRGVVVTAVGVRLPFEVTRVDAGRRWDWRVAGVPATGHVVAPTDDGCEVSIEVPTLAAPYLAVCHLALRRLERLAVTSA